MATKIAAGLCALLLITGVAGDEPASDINLKDVTVSLLEASGSEISTQQLTGPSTASLGSLDHTRLFKVSLSAVLQSAPGEEFRPQQVFLRLTHHDSNAAAYFAAVKSREGRLYATAKSSDIQKQIGQQGGTYDAALLVGDIRSRHPLLWPLGQLQVSHPPLDDGSQPVAAHYRAIDRQFRPLPEILHQHRKPDRRAPAVVSLFFALLALAPALLYVGAALQLGGNLKGFPSGAGFLPAAGFHLGLLAILALYALFWLRLNLMQTLPILAPLAGVTAFLGHSTLKELTGARPKQE